MSLARVSEVRWALLTEGGKNVWRMFIDKNGNETAAYKQAIADGYTIESLYSDGEKADYTQGRSTRSNQSSSKVRWALLTEGGRNVWRVFIDKNGNDTTSYKQYLLQGDTIGRLYSDEEKRDYTEWLVHKDERKYYPDDDPRKHVTMPGSEERVRWAHITDNRGRGTWYVFIDKDGNDTAVYKQARLSRREDLYGNFTGKLYSQAEKADYIEWLAMNN